MSRNPLVMRSISGRDAEFAEIAGDHGSLPVLEFYPSTCSRAMDGDIYQIMVFSRILASKSSSLASNWTYTEWVANLTGLVYIAPRPRQPRLV
jgi:hypothetical protein